MDKNEDRHLSYADIVEQMGERKKDVRAKMQAAVGGWGNHVSMQGLLNLAQLEIYNQLLVNEIISSELLQLRCEAKKLPAYKHEVKRMFNEIERMRLTYQHYTKNVMATNDGVFCDVADMYEEEVMDDYSLIVINVKQMFDKMKLDNSLFRSRLEAIKLLIQASMDIYVEVCAASEISLQSNGVITNRHTDFSRMLYLVCRVEEEMGVNPRTNDENIEKSAEKLIRKIALGSLAMKCFDKVRDGRDASEMPYWYPILQECKPNDIIEQENG